MNTTPAGKPGSSMRRLGLALVAAAALTSACTAAPPPPPEPVPTPPTTTTTPACPEPGVVITAGVSDAATGLRAQSIEMVNCGTEAYEVNGYPTIRVLDEERKSLAVKVNNGTTSIEDAGPSPVTLRPGERAVAAVLWRNTVTDGVPLNGVYLEIAPVAGQPAQTVRPEYKIDLGTTGQLDVTAWHLP